MADILMNEHEIAGASLTGNYQELVAEGSNQIGKKMMIRNTTASRLQFRVNGDDTQTFTVSPDEKFLIGGFSALRGQGIEVRTVTDIPLSIRMNLYG